MYTFKKSNRGIHKSESVIKITDNVVEEVNRFMYLICVVYNLEGQICRKNML